MVTDETFAWLRELTGNSKRLADAEIVGLGKAVGPRAAT
jgi:hypothetical protein